MITKRTKNYQDLAILVSEVITKPSQVVLKDLAVLVPGGKGRGGA